jgi:hypothetical protein
MNLCNAQAESSGVGISGAGGTLGCAANAGPAHPLMVGAVGFGPAWTMEDSMAASIVRLECENEELRAQAAMNEVERGILVRELERLREMVADERARDAACAEKCRDKAAADGGWANI